MALASDWKPAFQNMPESAWQPHKGDFSLGSSYTRFSPTDRLSFSTVPLLYTVGALNGSSKISILKNDKWWINGDIGFLRLNLGRFSDEIDEVVDATFFIYPMQFKITYRLHEHVSIGTILRHNQMGIYGKNKDNDQFDVSGLVATSNSHIKWNICFALSDIWSFTYSHNRLIYQKVQAQNYNAIELDNGSTLELFLQGSSDIINYSGSLSQGYRLYRKGTHFDTMIGFEKGYVPFYTVGFIVPQKIILPFIAMNWYL